MRPAESPSKPVRNPFKRKTQSQLRSSAKFTAKVQPKIGVVGRPKTLHIPPIILTALFLITHQRGGILILYINLHFSVFLKTVYIFKINEYILNLFV